GVRLSDEGSANGTWLGDRRVSNVLLDHLDRFRVGAVVFEVARDDAEAGGEMAPEDLDAARTTSVPIQEVLQSIALRLTTKLEQEGDAVLVSGNKPFFLDDPSVCWLVEEGRMDVFTVAMKDGEPAGARTHFVSVEAGQGMVGMDLATYGMGSGFLASGKTG